MFTPRHAVLLTALIAPLAAADDGDTPATATVLSLGIRVDASLDRNDDVDVFRIDLDGRAEVEIRSSGRTTDTHGVLTDSDGMEIASDDDGGSGMNFRFLETLEGGAYYVTATGVNGDTGDYGMIARIRRLGDDHGDTIRTSTIVTAAELAGQISPGTDVDTFRLDVNAPANIRLRTHGPADTFGQLQNSAGDVLVEGDMGGDRGNFQLRRTVEPGIYYLTVSSASGEIGTYTLDTDLGEATPCHWSRTRVTAAQVTDRASLRAFVEEAKSYIESITDINEGGQLRERLRTEGDFKSGSMFLIVFLKSGEPFIHGNDRTAESKNLLGVEDDRGTRVVEALFRAAARGGGFVDYDDGGPKTAYAVEYTSGITGREFVLVGGYSQDVTHVPIVIADLPTPAVVASQVLDRETLITFVEEAARTYREAVLSEGYATLTAVRNAFRQEGGDWKSGSIYLWVVSGGGVTLFHGSEPFREGKRTDMTRTDVNGVRFAEELIGGARREGRKFLRYYYDDPSIQGDEDTGSPKLGYAVSFEVPNSPQRAVIGSGIYLGSDE